MQEIWKDIKGYEGWYKISNLGRVKSLKKWCGNKYSIKWIKEENILSPTDNGNGYLIIGLRKDTKKKNFYIHRLVAEHFIENNLNKEEVNHIDFNKRNNIVSNLEWCDRKENVEHSRINMFKQHNTKTGRTGEKYILYRNNRYRVVVNKYDRTFKTLEEAITFRDSVLSEVV